MDKDKRDIEIELLIERIMYQLYTINGEYEHMNIDNRHVDELSDQIEELIGWLKYIGK